MKNTDIAKYSRDIMRTKRSPWLTTYLLLYLIFCPLTALEKLQENKGKGRKLDMATKTYNPSP